MKPRIGEHYSHYKNHDNHYEIICLAKNTDTHEDLVVYKALYPVLNLGEEFAKNPIFVRKLEEFMDIFPDGRKRFERII